MAGAFLLSGCGDRFPDYRYKMTVVVATPEGERSFSSVREVRQEERFSVLDSSGRTVWTELTGEAVIMDLPGRRTVYALLDKPDRSEYAEHIAGAALLPMVRRPKRDPRFDDLTSKPGEYLDRQAAEQQAMVKTVGPRELPRIRTVNSLGVPLNEPLDLWPMLVTFDDPADPTTVREVTPESIGVRRIMIEITDEPISEGIDQKLTWLADQKGALVRTARGRSMYDQPAAQHATGGSFRIGFDR